MAAPVVQHRDVLFEVLAELWVHLHDRFADLLSAATLKENLMA